MTARRALITGAASGIGATTVKILLARGWAVVAADRDVDGLRRAAGSAARTITLDVTDRAAVGRELGGLQVDAVANIAGLGSAHRGGARDILMANLVAPLYVLEAVRPGLTTGGAVVNIASIAADLADDRYDAALDNPLDAARLDDLAGRVADNAEAYNYSKRGILRQSERLAVAWAPGIRVNVVSPGLIDTPLGRRSLEQRPWTKVLAARTPLQRIGTPEDVAYLIAFLLDSEASGFMTGANIVIDGGYTCLLRVDAARPQPAV